MGCQGRCGERVERLAELRFLDGSLPAAGLIILYILLRRFLSRKQWPVWDLESYKAYISLDKPAVRDANDTMIKKQSQCKIWQAGNERRILKRSYLCEQV